MVSPSTVPPAPHVFLSNLSTPGRSLAIAVKPRTTVTTLPFFLFSRCRVAVCFSGAIRAFCWAVHWQTLSSSLQRSHVGGISKGVPSKSRIALSSRSRWPTLKAEILAQKTKAQTLGSCDPIKSFVAFNSKVMAFDRPRQEAAERTGKVSFQSIGSKDLDSRRSHGQQCMFGIGP